MFTSTTTKRSCRTQCDSDNPALSYGKEQQGDTASHRQRLILQNKGLAPAFPEQRKKHGRMSTSNLTIAGGRTRKTEKIFKKRNERQKGLASKTGTDGVFPGSHAEPWDQNQQKPSPWKVETIRKRERVGEKRTRDRPLYGDAGQRVCGVSTQSTRKPWILS